LVPSSASGQESGSASTQPLASEYQRLRAELDRVNAEVAALKRRGRSVRTEYLLRDKMAEAEALARNVTAAESRLRAVRGAVPAETPAGMVRSNWRPRLTSCPIRRVAFVPKPKPWRVPRNRSGRARPCAGAPERGTVTRSPGLKHRSASRSLRPRVHTGRPTETQAGILQQLADPQRRAVTAYPSRAGAAQPAPRHRRPRTLSGRAPQSRLLSDPLLCPPSFLAAPRLPLPRRPPRQATR